MNSRTKVSVIPLIFFIITVCILFILIEHFYVLLMIILIKLIYDIRDAFSDSETEPVLGWLAVDIIQFHLSMV